MQVIIQFPRVVNPLLSLRLILLASLLATPHMRACAGQAPGLLWSTSVGAQVFAVDTQTNVYANAGGAVIELSGAGVPLKTNALSVYPGMAQRDSAGNLYYAGNYPGTPNGFGGYDYTNPACFLAKYTSAGALVWSVDFGPSGTLRGIGIGDFTLDTARNGYVGYTYNTSTRDHIDKAAKFNSAGSNIWPVVLPKASFSSTVGSVRFGPVSPTNGYALTFNSFSPSYVTMCSLGSNGAALVLARWTAMSGTAWQESRPIPNSLGDFYQVEGSALTKRSASAAIIWSNNLASDSAWTVGQDKFEGVHLGDDNSSLSRYDYDGALVWAMNLASVCNGLVSDAAGNRFISLLDGTVARLGDELLQSPVITNAPQGQTVLAGSNALFSVGAQASTPVRYYWLYNNNPLANQTNAALNLQSVTPAQAGLYSVIVSNFLGSVTSAPALLRVKSVAIFLGDQLLTNGTYSFASPPTLSVRSAFMNGSAFYTLDGSPPSLSSIPYTGPFTVTQNATVRAIGYSADFAQSEEADSVNVMMLVNHTLTASASGGGSIGLSPPGGTYLSTNIVSATAVASPGSFFFYWLGDAAGTGATVNISMERDKTIYAVFGTTLATTVAGSGQVLLNPPGGRYPYGAIVRLTGVPQPGSNFGSWGNAATGNINPLYFGISSPTQTVSAIFGVLPANQASLTVLINGAGRVNLNPQANAYPTNQSVALTAVPDSGQSFVNWSGDASATQNPLTISMNVSKVITANFSDRPFLRASRPGVEGLTAQGFRFTLVNDLQLVWQIFGTTNLATWDNLGKVTNSTGEVQFTDPGALSRPQRFYRATQ